MGKKALGVEAYLGTAAVGWVPYHPEVARAFARCLPRMRSHLAQPCAIFLALVYRWSGRSTRHAGGWFDKRLCDWADEVGVSDRRMREVLDWCCRRLGLVERAPCRDGADRYRICPEQVRAWWLLHGPAPALPVACDRDPVITCDRDPSITCDRDPSITCDRIQRNTERPSSAATSSVTGGVDNNDDKLRTWLDVQGIGEPTLSELVRDLRGVHLGEVVLEVNRAFRRAEYHGNDGRGLVVTVLRDLARRKRAREARPRLSAEEQAAAVIRRREERRVGDGSSSSGACAPVGG